MKSSLYEPWQREIVYISLKGRKNWVHEVYIGKTKYINISREDAPSQRESLINTPA